MFGRVLGIAWFTMLEGARTRLALLAVVLALGGIALAEFAASIAITETREYRIALLAGTLRLGMVFLLASFAIAGMVRDFHGGAAALYLSRPLPRAEYFAGCLLGYSVISLFLASGAGVLLAMYAVPGQALIWATSLGFELLLVAALSLTCVVSFNQMPAALGAVGAFYLLARAIGAIQLMSTGPLIDSGSLFQRFAALFARGIGYLLPELWRYTDASWVIHGTGSWSLLPSLVIQTLVYLLLLTAVGLFDLYRKSL